MVSFYLVSSQFVFGYIPEFVHLSPVLFLSFLFSLQHNEQITFGFGLYFPSALLSSFLCPHLYFLVLICVYIVLDTDYGFFFFFQALTE